jgi:hypothetical protein
MGYADRPHYYDRQGHPLTFDEYIDLTRQLDQEAFLHDVTVRLVEVEWERARREVAGAAEDSTRLDH